MKKKIFLSALLILLVILIALLLRWKVFPPNDTATTDQNSEINEIPAKPVLEYGLPVDSFEIYRDEIKYGQNLSLILPDFNVSYQKIDQIEKRSKNVFNIRNIRSGNKYAIFSTKDSIKKARYFIYENTPVEYIVFDLNDTVSIYIREKELFAVQKSGIGVINTSLWNAMIKNEIDFNMAFELAELFAWCVDFYGLQKGDVFKVIYDEEYIDSLPVRLGQIHAAWFLHKGREFYAIPFTQDSIKAYFDQYGNNLDRLFLKIPLRFSVISSRFSYNRFHPILNIWRPHQGIDFSAPVGTPVLAAGDGIISETSYYSDAGLFIKIRHDSIHSSGYLHLSRYEPGIKEEKKVKKGDVIGYVGSSGLSTGPHLDYRFWINNILVDPLRMKSPPLDSVKTQNKHLFDSIKNVLMNKLDTIRVI